MGSLELPYFAVEKHSSFFSFAQTFSPSQDLFSHWPTQPDSTHQPDPLLKFPPSLTGEFQHVLRLLFQPLNLLAASASPRSCLFVARTLRPGDSTLSQSWRRPVKASVGVARARTRSWPFRGRVMQGGGSLLRTHACVWYRV